MRLPSDHCAARAVVELIKIMHMIWLTKQRHEIAGALEGEPRLLALGEPSMADAKLRGRYFQ